MTEDAAGRLTEQVEMIQTLAEQILDQLSDMQGAIYDAVIDSTITAEGSGLA